MKIKKDEKIRLNVLRSSGVSQEPWKEGRIARTRISHRTSVGEITLELLSFSMVQALARMDLAIVVETVSMCQNKCVLNLKCYHSW